MWAIVNGAYLVNAVSGTAEPERFDDVEMRPNRLIVRRVTIAMPMTTRVNVAIQTRRFSVACGRVDELMPSISRQT
jgi:hypothetical protein